MLIIGMEYSHKSGLLKRYGCKIWLCEISIYSKQMLKNAYFSPEIWHGELPNGTTCIMLSISTGNHGYYTADSYISIRALYHYFKQCISRYTWSNIDMYQWYILCGFKPKTLDMSTNFMGIWEF